MKLSEIKRFLAEGNIRLTKSLGQNFLHDANQLRRIVRAAALSKTDKVLEIGPGLGPLTELLVEQAGEVLAIEKDARLVELLCERFRLESRLQPVGGAPAKPPEGGTPNLLLRHADALDYLRREPCDWSAWKLVANLPYSVASPILVDLAQSEHGPQRMVVTLQLEVAQRIAAKPSHSDYGVLSLLVQLRYGSQGLFKIPASCFFPEPGVDSACLTLVRRARPLLTQEQSRTFAGIVKRSFSQRRKMMLKLLKIDWPATRLEVAFQAIGLDARTRAEDVSLEQFVKLAELLHPAAPT